MRIKTKVNIMREELEKKDLTELRDIADELGIDYPKTIGKVKLIDKILDDEAESQSPTILSKEVEGVAPKKKESASEIKKRMNKLVRCRISSNDPQYKGRNGVTLQVGNKTTVVGKFIPFNTIWHVQEPVFKSLKAKTYRQTTFKTDRTTGLKVPVTNVYPSFVIEELPQLTEAELKKLAAEQAARGSIPNESGE